MIVTLLAILGVTILGGVWLLRRLRQDPATPALMADSDGAQDLLRRRYAAGEIDEEEFERRLSALTLR